MKRSRTAGIEIARALAHALEMQARALDGGDQIGGRARQRGLRNLDLVIGMQRGGDPVERDMRFGKQALLEIAARDRDAQTVGAALERLAGRLDPALDAHRIVGIAALHDIVGEREIAHAAGERAEMIEACHERKRAVARQPSIRGLQPEDAAQRRRHPDRPVGVGAERERNESAGNCAARTAGRTAGHALEVMRVARGTVVHVLAGEVVGVFAHVERADENGAGGFQAFDQRRVAARGRQVAIDLGARERAAGRRRRTDS